jgi:tRNA(Ile)-lysidine synthase
LEAYLHVIGQPFREDPSNADRRFTRNRIRHGLLPLLARQYNSAVSDALLRLGSLAADVQAVIDGLVDQLYERAVKFENSNSVEINAALLAGQAPYLLRELLVCVWRRQSWPMRAMGFTQWDQLARLLAETDRSSPAVVSKQIFPGNVQAEIRHGKLRLLRVE